MDKATRHIVIVGGGTAGWLTAGLLAADHCSSDANGIKVTLVESPDVPILGVGEGSWPSLRDTLRRIGVSETDFVRRCQASFKQGSQFNGWTDGNDQYLHPFDAPPNVDHVDPLAVWDNAAERSSFSDAVSAQGAVCREGCAPKQAATPEYAAVTNYGYHLDAGAFADLLKEHCTEKLGVAHIRDTVTGVDLEGADTVTSLQTKSGRPIAADIYVDCTGMRAELIGQVSSEALIDASSFLFNDRALAVQVPYTDPKAKIPSPTVATATTAGWVWDIALQNRRGIGHVYSSAHQREDEGRACLSKYLADHAPGAAVSGSDARLISFRSAYRSKPWVGNVIAIGMSQGFVEPLEASAIVMVELSATMLSDTLPPTHAAIPGAASRFNERFSYRWGRIIDFLKLHYVLSKREGAYWDAHRDRATWSPRLAELIDRWRWEPPSREDFPQAREIFPASSYAFVLYGMGFDTARRPTRRRTQDDKVVGRFSAELETRKQRLVAGLPSNRELIEHIVAHGLGRG